MTVASTNKRNSYSGDASTTNFDYTFRILDEDHIEVSLVDSSGNITVQTKTTHYTVTGVGDSGGGTISFVSAPAATETVILKRNIPVKQETDYTENDTFPAETHEQALDKLTMICQQLSDRLDRAISVPDNGVISTTTLNDDSLTAEYLLRVDTAGGAIETVATTTVLNDNLDDLTGLSSMDSANDLFLIYDNSASTFKKITGSNLLGASTNKQALGGDAIAVTNAATNFTIDLELTELTAATPTTSDTLVIADADDSNAIKKIAISDLLDLSTEGITIEVDGVGVSTGDVTLDFSGAQFSLTESPTDDFDITLKESGIDHNSLNNYDSLEHIDWTNTSQNFKTTGTATITDLDAGSLDVAGNATIDGTTEFNDNLDINAQVDISGSITVNTGGSGHITTIGPNVISDLLQIEVAASSDTLSAVIFSTFSQSATADFGQIVFNVDESNILNIVDAGIDVVGNITVSGTVDGRDIATDGAKLDNIEANADVTDEANVTSALDGATLTAATVATGDKVLIQDIDDSNNLKTATAQSIADLYVPANITLAGDSGSSSIALGDTLTVSGGTNVTTSESKGTLTINVDDAFLLNTGDVGTGSYNFGGATSLEIPNGAAPTVDAAGEIAVDTTITDHTGLITYHDGTEALYAVGLPVANLSTVDGAVVQYDALNNEFTMDTVAGGSGLNDVVDDTTPQLGGQLDVNGNAIGDGTRELLTFTENASAVNHVNIENQATGGGPIISAAGDDANVDLVIDGKGTGDVVLSSSNLDVTGNIVVSGTVDGRDIATDGTKLDGIEASADVTDATNVDAAGAVMNTDTSTASMSFVIDEDNMASDSATKVPTQQSVKAYVDASAGGGDYELIGSATASNDATISFTGLTSSYSSYMLIFDSVVPATDIVSFYMRTSTNAGSSYDSGASDYAWTRMRWRVTTGSSVTDLSEGDYTSDALILTNNIGSDSNEMLSGELRLYNPSGTNYTQANWKIMYVDNGASLQAVSGSGFRLSAADVDAIQFLFSSGNIESGNFYLYGLKNS